MLPGSTTPVLALAQDYANLELRVLANDAAYVEAMERAYPHLKGED